MFGQIDEIKNLAFKYSKEQLGRMAQMGMIDPQKAMLAGMMRDRVSKEDTKPPTTTVAQDILAPQQQQPQQQMGMQQPQQQQQPQPQQMGMPQQAPVPQAPTQMAATGGVTSLPVQEQDYAGGGIVAFAGDEGSLVGYNEYGAPPDLRGDDLSPAERLASLFDSNYRPYRPPVKPQAAAAPNQTDAETARLTRQNNSTTNPFYTPPAPAPAPKVDADKARTNVGGPRLPALNEPTGKIDIQEYSARPVQELDAIEKEKRDAYIKAGIDPDLYNKMMDKEEKKRGALGKRKEEAKGEFLMNLGVGLMGAKRGREFEALGAGAKEGLASYKDAMKDVRATEERLDDRINAWTLADNQAKKTGTDASLAKRDRQGELVEAAKMKNIEARNAANAEEVKVAANIFATKTAADTSRYVAGVNAQTQREYTAALKQQGLQDSQIKNIMGTAAEIQKNKISAGDTEYTMEQAIKEAMSAYRQVAPMTGKNMPSAAPAPATTLTPAELQKIYGISPTK